jgi:hypothetical protein
LLLAQHGSLYPTLLDKSGAIPRAFGELMLLKMREAIIAKGAKFCQIWRGVIIAP